MSTGLRAPPPLTTTSSTWSRGRTKRPIFKGTLVFWKSDARMRADGTKLLYFSRLPFGRAIYKASVGADGILRGFEHTLSDENMLRLRPDAMTKDDVRELLGPPWRISREPRRPWETWEYPWTNLSRDLRTLWVSFSDDGILRYVLEQHDYIADPPTDPGFP